MAWVLVDSEAGQRRDEDGRIYWYSEEVANDADKIFDVDTDGPEGAQSLEVLGIRVEYAATATAGNRNIVIQLRDSGATDVIAEVEFAHNPVANDNIPFYAAPGLESRTGTANHNESFPANFFLLPGQELRIFDQANVDATADDMQVHLCLKAR